MALGQPEHTAAAVGRQTLRRGFSEAKPTAAAMPPRSAGMRQAGVPAVAAGGSAMGLVTALCRQAPGRRRGVDQVAHDQMDNLIESQRDDMFALGGAQFGVAAEQQFCLASDRFPRAGPNVTPGFGQRHPPCPGHRQSDDRFTAEDRDLDRQIGGLGTTAAAAQKTDQSHVGNPFRLGEKTEWQSTERQGHSLGNCRGTERFA